MRKIKFRSWNTRIKDMGQVYQLHFDENGINMSENYIFMQSTELADKNGKEIYEGDIVRVVQHERFNSSRIEYIGEVKYELCFEVISHTSENGDELHKIYNPYYEIEVIGNIYENPELIK